jgi:hypothetical protein
MLDRLSRTRLRMKSCWQCKRQVWSSDEGLAVLGTPGYPRSEYANSRWLSSEVLAYSQSTGNSLIGVGQADELCAATIYS